MVTPTMILPEALSKAKLDAFQVSVNEVDSDSPPHSIDRLTMQSPRPQMHAPTVTRSPHYVPTDPNICRLPARDPGLLRASSPTGSVRSSFTSNRRVSRRSRHSHVSSRSHSHEVSRELTIQAESEFFALMELMSGITLRSSSLKEVWRKIISERESHHSEMESMYERIEEFSETIERHEKEKHSHGHEHEERKKEVLKLQLDLKIAIEATAGYKKKLHDRDCELEKAHGEIAEWTDNFKYLKEEHEETKTELVKTQLRIVELEEACRLGKAEIEKHHGELKHWKHKHSELERTTTEMTTKFESTSTELKRVKTINSTWEKERIEWLREKDELEEEVGKCRHDEKEHKRKLIEITELLSKKKHELHESTEKVTKMKHEREELRTTIKTLTSQLDEATTKCDAAEKACRKWRARHDECSHLLTKKTEEYTSLETSFSETKSTLTKITTEVHVLKEEKEALECDYEAKCKEFDASHRAVLLVEEKLRRAETTIKEKLELIHTHTERIERLSHDLAHYKKSHADLCAERDTLQSTNLSLSLSLETAHAEHASVREKLHECETRYESVRTSISEYHESGGHWDEEVEELTREVEEAREQRDRAVKMRVEADRQRDEYVGRYEAKCREVERLQGRKKGGGVFGGRDRWASGSTYSRSVIGEEDEDVVVCGGA
jgi:chromosome segregation ATPase